jgi:hypothetical protein
VITRATALLTLYWVVANPCQLPPTASLPPPSARPWRVPATMQITNGLDAATALDICAFLSEWAHSTGGTVITALQAPTPEVVATFDDVLVLSEGHILYHGPPAQLGPYLAAAGYACPSYADVADFTAQLATSPSMTAQLYGA